jgi:hypothetical protein
MATDTDTRPGTPDELTALLASVPLTGPELDAFIAETNAQSERFLADFLAHEAERLVELTRPLVGAPIVTLPEDWLFDDDDGEDWPDRTDEPLDGWPD